MSRSRYRAQAEYDQLKSVRVHRPGYEVVSGVLDPQPSLFLNNFSLFEGQKEHEKLVEVLENEGVDVHHLHEDLAEKGKLNEMVREIHKKTDIKPQKGVGEELTNEVRERIRDNLKNLEDIPDYGKLQAVAGNISLTRLWSGGEGVDYDGRKDSTNVLLENPMADLFFQRDQQFLTAEGPVIANPKFPVRRQELDIVKEAWLAIGAEPVDVREIEDESTIEGGDFIPVGDFALIGVAERGRVEKSKLRTSEETAKALLESDVFGVDEVALVHAPLEKAREKNRKEKREEAYSEEPDMDIMHLDTWFNIVDKDLAVGHKDYMESTTVDIYLRENGTGTYENVESMNFRDYIEKEKGFEIVNIPFKELPPGANFLTLDRGKILAISQTCRGGDYKSDKNRVLEKLKHEWDVDIIPNGTGIQLENLTRGGGGIHCMTCPLKRG